MQSAPLALSLPLLALAPGLAAQGPRSDWFPTAAEIVLNTDSQQITTSTGTVTVRGGVFVFRNVTIPAGAVVRGAGSNPLVFVLAGTFRLEGEVSVRGGDGETVTTLNSANFPARGGVAVCGGGDGGLGSPNTNSRSFTGGTGKGPLQTIGLGGQGGRINCANSSCGIGSGGGGGGFATVGDPYFKVAPSQFFLQPTGVGGYGCSSRTSTTLPGGRPGIVYFGDTDPANDFLGVAVDVFRRRVIQGELTILVGGSGGGGGGDYALSCATSDPGFFNDEKGAGGGAGGGVFIVAAEGPVILGPRGRIDASGGNGGGGAWAGSSTHGGGGGGGAGGMVAILSRTSIDITVHGETYANNDYDFAVSADGGVGKLYAYGGGGTVVSKYYPAPSASNMNARPSGGLGGLGLIQFFALPGTNQDGTNTLLDDNVVLRNANGVLTGAAKQRFLAWRGFRTAQDTWRDDVGNAVNIGNNEGDFRPTPILLPIF